MLRIAHRLASMNVAEDDTFWHAMSTSVRSNRAHVVCCDNVADYTAAEQHGEVDVTEIPGVTAPWSLCLYEWRTARPMAVRGKPVQQQAVFMSTLDLKSESGDEDRGNLLSLISSCRSDADARLRHEAADAIRQARWWMTIRPLMVYGGVLRENTFAIHVAIDGGGAVMEQFSVADNGYSVDVARGAAGLIHDTLHVAYLASSMMNCKNVSTVDSTAEDAPPVKWQRRMKTPEIRYSRIKIDGFTSEAKSQGGGIDGHNKAWHICRGHFAEYNEKPLFGKYRGRFWIPQHVRGDKKHGEVHSTHEVVAGSS